MGRFGLAHPHATSTHRVSLYSFRLKHSRPKKDSQSIDTFTTRRWFVILKLSRSFSHFLLDLYWSMFANLLLHQVPWREVIFRTIFLGVLRKGRSILSRENEVEALNLSSNRTIDIRHTKRNPGDTISDAFSILFNPPSPKHSDVAGARRASRFDLPSLSSSFSFYLLVFLQLLPRSLFLIPLHLELEEELCLLFPFLLWKHGANTSWPVVKKFTKYLQISSKAASSVRLFQARAL